MIQRRLLEGNLNRLRGENREHATWAQSPLATDKAEKKGEDRRKEPTILLVHCKVRSGCNCRVPMLWRENTSSVPRSLLPRVDAGWYLQTCLERSCLLPSSLSSGQELLLMFSPAVPPCFFYMCCIVVASSDQSQGQACIQCGPWPWTRSELFFVALSHLFSSSCFCLTLGRQDSFVIFCVSGV